MRNTGIETFKILNYELRNLHFLSEHLDSGNVCPACPKVCLQYHYSTTVYENSLLFSCKKDNGKIVYVTVEGRNQTLFTLSTFEKKSSKSRNFYCKASVMTKVNFD